VAQISEFSIVFVAMGMSLGHVGGDTLGLVTLIGLVTISVCTYLVLNSQTLYEKLKFSLSVFERRIPFRERMTIPKSEPTPAVVVFGLGRYGGRLMQRLCDQDINTLGVDFDPEAVRHARHRGLNARFGDAEDAELPASLPLAEVRWAVSTLHDSSVNRVLITALREHGYTGPVAVTAYSEADIDMLKKVGAELIFYPYFDAAEYAADKLQHILRENEVPA